MQVYVHGVAGRSPNSLLKFTDTEISTCKQCCCSCVHSSRRCYERGKRQQSQTSVDPLQHCGLHGSHASKFLDQTAANAHACQAENCLLILCHPIHLAFNRGLPAPDSQLRLQPESLHARQI